jgi:hypothetical protein
LTCVDVAKTDDQLVSRYIGGLRQQIQDSINLFDPVNVLEAHQRALLLEKTMAIGSTGFFGGGIGGGMTRSSGLLTPQNTTLSSNSNRTPTTTRPPNRGATTSGPSAFDVVNWVIGLQIAARERNMVRVYLLTQETPLKSKVRKRSKKQPSTTMGMLRKNLLLEMMVRA